MAKKFYTKDEISIMLIKENPTFSSSEIDNKTIEIHRALNTLDVSWRRSCKRFYDHVVLIDDDKSELLSAIL